MSARAELSWESDASVLCRFIDQAPAEILRIPGVADVAVIDRLPIEGNSQDSPLLIDGQPERTRDSIGTRMGTTNSFALLGVPLLARALPADEGAISVNSDLASQNMRSQPLGRSISFDNKAWFRVVAAVGSLQNTGRENKPHAEINLSPPRTNSPLLAFVVRTSNPSGNLNATLLEMCSGLHPDLDYRGAIPSSKRLDEVVTSTGSDGFVWITRPCPRNDGCLRCHGGRDASAVAMSSGFGLRLAHIGGKLCGLPGGTSQPADWPLPIALVVIAGLSVSGLTPVWHSAQVDPLVSLRQF